MSTCKKWARWCIFFFLETNFFLNTIPRATLCKILIFNAFPISQKRLDRILYKTHHITLDPSKGLFTWRWGTPGRWGNPFRWAGVTRLSIKSLILMWSRLHVRWDDLPHVTSPTWGPPASYKQALKEAWSHQNITVFITLPQFVLTGCFFLPRGPFSFCPFWSNRVRTLFWTKCSKTFQGLSRTHFPFLKHSIQCKKEPWVCLF